MKYGPLVYGDNFEDVRLKRVFQEPSGFYIDVGACDPKLGSITKHFYNRGWRGINIEPSLSGIGKFQESRPEDVNIQCAVSDETGSQTLYTFPEVPFLTTLQPELAQRHEAQLSARATPLVVPTQTLAEICEAHVASRAIDFMVIDVEGHEREVLAGADFSRFRPKVVVVEATEPLTRIATHEAWEPLLLRAGYETAAFDGCNRYYVEVGNTDFLEALAMPICFFDQFLHYRQLRPLFDMRDELRASTRSLNARRKVAEICDAIDALDD